MEASERCHGRFPMRGSAVPSPCGTSPGSFFILSFKSRICDVGIFGNKGHDTGFQEDANVAGVKK